MSDLESLLEEAQSTDFETKTVAVAKLGTLGDPQAFDIVLTILSEEAVKDDEYWEEDELFLECIYTLGAIGNKRAIPHMREILTTHGNIFAKEKAGEALGKLGDRSFLLSCLDYEDEFIRANALRGLGYAIDQDSSELFDLATESLRDRSVEVISSAIAMLERIGDPRAITCIKPFIDKHALNYSGVALSEQATRAIKLLETGSYT